MLPRYRAPILMATQHPDSTRVITTSQEVEEAIEAISLFRCDEIMVDYEGKLTPYHQPEWIVDKAHEKGLRAGIDFLISLRIPNDMLEGASRHIHSIVTALITNWKAQRMGLEQPVRYIIIPMVESTNLFQAVVRRVSRLQHTIHEELGLEEGYIDIVPLLESVDSQLEIHRYVETISRQEGRNPWTHRIFLGKSDSALLSGHIASSLALRIALSKLYRASEERDLEISPIIGMGKPPFRGHMAPHNIERWARTWRGYRTATIQTAMRYDTDRGEYEHMRSIIISNSRGKPEHVDEESEKGLREIIRLSSSKYMGRIRAMANAILEVSEHVANTRERVSFKEYGRSSGEILLPRAIAFTALFYTIGLPPALIDIGVLNSVSGRDLEILIETYNIYPDYQYDLNYYSEEILSKWLPREIFEDIRRDIRKAIENLGITPKGDVDQEYWRYGEKVLRSVKKRKTQEAQSYIAEMAKIRGFLG